MVPLFLGWWTLVDDGFFLREAAAGTINSAKPVLKAIKYETKIIAVNANRSLPLNENMAALC